MRARIECIADGSAYIDVDEIDGKPPAEVMIQPQVTVRWGDSKPDELTIPLAGVEDGVAVYRSRYG
jgi:hypothetical protein